MPAQKFLGEGFGAFELRGRAPRAEAFQAGLLEFIDDADDERGFRADDRQINMLGARERNESGDVFRGDFDISNLGLVRGAGIAGGNQNFGDARRRRRISRPTRARVRRRQ